MEKGTVKWFDDKKGYGFIEIDGTEGKDVFVHHTAIQGQKNQFKTLKERQRVEFEIRTGPKGKQADQVTAIEG